MTAFSEKIEAAKSADLLELVQAMGYPVKRSGNNGHCLIEHDSLKISNNKWYWHSQEIGGSTIDFAMHFPTKDGRDLKEAVNYVLETTKSLHFIPETYKQPQTAVADGKFTLPEKADTPSRVVAYLTATRGIDHDIVWENIRNGNLYQSKNTNNCVFVGRDTGGVPHYGFMRGTLSDKRFARDCNGSDKSYGFLMKAKGFTNSIFVYESPIDAMSHATISKRHDTTHDTVDRLSLGGVSDKSLERYLKDNPSIKNVVLCLDNDEAGRNATVRIREKLSGQYNLSSYPPKHKDFNEDLLAILKPKRELTI